MGRGGGNSGCLTMKEEIEFSENWSELPQQLVAEGRGEFLEDWSEFPQQWVKDGCEFLEDWREFP